MDKVEYINPTVMYMLETYTMVYHMAQAFWTHLMDSDLKGTSNMDNTMVMENIEWQMEIRLKVGSNKVWNRAQVWKLRPNYVLHIEEIIKVMKNMDLEF